MDLSKVLDAVLPGPGSRLDRMSEAAQRAVTAAAERPGVQPLAAALHGNRWLGHPLHPVLVVLPIGAWSVSSWFDWRGARHGHAADDHAADVALRVGMVTSVAAAAAGVAQYGDTRDAARRTTALHASLNTTALALYLASHRARTRGRRSRGRTLSAVALGIVGLSGYLGGDVSYRHGVGVRPQALRDHDVPVAETRDEPLDTADARHP